MVLSDWAFVSSRSTAYEGTMLVEHMFVIFCRQKIDAQSRYQSPLSTDLAENP